VLIVLLIIACDGVPVVENPISTLLNAQRRFQQLVAMLRARGISRLADLGIVPFLGSSLDEQLI